MGSSAASSGNVGVRPALVGATDGDSGIRSAIDRFYIALNHVVNGDPRPMLALWSREPDASLLDPRGALLRGWDAIRTHWEWLAKVTSCGRVMVSDVQVGGGSLAYVTATEHVRATVHRQSVRVAVRTTTLYAPAVTGSGWRVVHRHSDPLPLLEHALRGQSEPLKKVAPWKD